MNKKGAEKTDLTKTAIKPGQCDCVIDIPIGESRVFRGAFYSIKTKMNESQPKYG
jgi:hypothetical protein